MTHVTCRLTAKNWDQLWNHTLGSRVWAIFTFFSGIKSAGNTTYPSRSVCRQHRAERTRATQRRRRRGDTRRELHGNRDRLRPRRRRGRGE